MDGSQASDAATPEPSRPRTVFDGFRRPPAPSAAEDTVVEASEHVEPTPLSAETGIIELPVTEAVRQAEAALPPASSPPVASETVEMAMDEAVRAAVLSSQPLTQAVQVAICGVRGLTLERLRRYLANPRWRTALLGSTLFVVLVVYVSGYSVNNILALGLLLTLCAAFGWVLYFLATFKRSKDLILDAEERAYLRSTGMATLRREVAKTDGLNLSLSCHGICYGIYCLTLRLGLGPGQTDCLDFRIEHPTALQIPWQRMVIRLAQYLRSPGDLVSNLPATGELEPSPITVDYTKRARLLLEVRDAAGGLIYRHPGYHPHYGFARRLAPAYETTEDADLPVGTGPHEGPEAYREDPAEQPEAVVAGKPPAGALLAVAEVASPSLQTRDHQTGVRPAPEAYSWVSFWIAALPAILVVVGVLYFSIMGWPWLVGCLVLALALRLRARRAARRRAEEQLELGTVEVPMTNAARAVIVASRPPSASTWINVLVSLVFAAAAGSWVLSFLSSAGERVDVGEGWLPAVGVAISLALLIGIPTAGYRSARKRRDGPEEDAVAATFRRTIGPAMLLFKNTDDGGTYGVRLLDKALELDLRHPSALTPAWQEKSKRKGLLDIGPTHECPLEPSPITVDYTKHAHLLLEVRDAEGKVIYRHPAYHPD